MQIDRMSPESKVEEAVFFLRLLEETENEKPAETQPPQERRYEYYLSAFLGATESVVYYVETHADSRGKTADFKTWAKNVRGNPYRAFFNRVRSLDVHIDYGWTGTVRQRETPRPTTINEVVTAGPKRAGKDKAMASGSGFVFSASPSGIAETKVLLLCRDYLNVLRKAVYDARRNGLVS